MYKRGRRDLITYLTCPVCGLNMFVPRKKGYRREQEHVKTMYCPKCRKKRNFVQKGER